ncbi:MAG: GNAT family N-acetyltransferase [Chlorobi bacterium]|nr:GNAT family N-acetyltransferase [Chlorobiota bacterium]
MEKIIPPVPKEAIKAELTPDKFVRKTNNGGNEVYVFTHKDSPNLMRELGRLREITFRLAGGGTGKELDIDHYDLGEHPYHQLIVWDPDEEEILGGYRFIICSNLKKNHCDSDHLATSKLFTFNEKFIRDYLPHMIELGRSFVQPDYQGTSRSRRKGLFALDNLWDGLGAIVIENPHVRYFFGKMTMYPHFHKEARKLILYFLDKYFHDPEDLVIPKYPLNLEYNREEFGEIFSGKDYLEDYRILSKTVREMGENIPPLFNAYMNLSPTMRVFGTVINHAFGDVEETGIMITLRDMYISKINRHLASYREDYKIPGQK